MYFRIALAVVLLQIASCEQYCTPCDCANPNGGAGDPYGQNPNGGNGGYPSGGNPNGGNNGGNNGGYPNGGGAPNGGNNGGGPNGGNNGGYPNGGNNGGGPNGGNNGGAPNGGNNGGAPNGGNPNGGNNGGYPNGGSPNGGNNGGYPNGGNGAQPAPGCAFLPADPEEEYEPGPAFPEYPPAPPPPAGGYPQQPQSLVDQVFSNEGGKVVSHCPANGTKTWNIISFKSSGPRPYYINKGRKPNLQACVDECDKQGTCYFAMLNKAGNCYLLDTKAIESCRYLKSGHFGKIPIAERCAPLRPCQGAFKQCTEPRCALLQVARVYCESQDKQKAVEECYL